MPVTQTYFYPPLTKLLSGNAGTVGPQPPTLHRGDFLLRVIKTNHFFLFLNSYKSGQIREIIINQSDITKLNLTINRGDALIAPFS